MPEPDVDQIRADQRDRWEAAAAQWDDGIDLFYEASEPVSQWLLDHVDVQPGDSVLELAAGRGDLSLACAERGASVVCTDGAEAMVAVAERRAKAAGLEMECRQMELEWLDVPTASVDVIVCRFGYMLCVDPEAALRETRRALRPGGRLALAVWAPADQNPWLSAAPVEAIKAGHMERPDPLVPGPFRLGAPGQLEEVLASAGFVVGEVEAVPIALVQPSLDAFWDGMLGLSDSLQTIVRGLSPAEHYAFRDAVEVHWAPHVRPDGNVAVPGTALCALVEA